mmetsp:Transcript_111919/g.327272  ORF Transcript_111919/g.327272 Transcript_111919/m.327272 type:complete len:225 (-) Transcript_111919:686-1360(-)
MLHVQVLNFWGPVLPSAPVAVQELQHNPLPICAQCALVHALHARLCDSLRQFTGQPNGMVADLLSCGHFPNRAASDSKLRRRAEECMDVPYGHQRLPLVGPRLGAALVRTVVRNLSVKLRVCDDRHEPLARTPLEPPEDREEGPRLPTAQLVANLLGELLLHGQHCVGRRPRRCPRGGPDSQPPVGQPVAHLHQLEEGGLPSQEREHPLLAHEIPQAWTAAQQV